MFEEMHAYLERLFTVCRWADQQGALLDLSVLGLLRQYCFLTALFQMGKWASRVHSSYLSHEAAPSPHAGRPAA